MSDDNSKVPSIEIKTGYIHSGIVKNMIEIRARAGADPIGLICTGKISTPAKKMLKKKDISYLEIPEEELKNLELIEQETEN